MLTHPSILTFGFSEAGMFLKSTAGSEVKAVISIHGLNEYGVDVNLPHRLDLEFDDAEAPDPADVFATYHAIVRRRAELENGRRLLPPTKEHVLQIIEFAQSIQNLDGTLLCHCSGGISRSPAAAIICLAVWTGAGHEEYCRKYVKSRRPAAFPHPDLLRFADQILNREGKLLNA